MKKQKIIVPNPDGTDSVFMTDYLVGKDIPVEVYGLAVEIAQRKFSKKLEYNFIWEKSKRLADNIEAFVSAQIKPMPKWFPSQKLWNGIACKFLQITHFTK